MRKIRHFATRVLIAGWIALQTGCATNPVSLPIADNSRRADPAAIESRDARLSLPIGSEPELRHYLRIVAAGASPLDHFSAAARQRFLGSLRFRDESLIGYAYPILVDELAPQQIREVLALFGRDAPAFVLEEANQRTPDQRARAAAISASMTPEMLARYREFQAAIESVGNRAADVAAAWTQRFEALSAPAQLTTLSPGDLHLLYDATVVATIHTKNTAYLATLKRAEARLSALAAATPEQYTQMFRVLVLLRRFDAARALADAHPDLDVEQLPRILDRTPPNASGPGLLVVDATEDLLLRQAANLPRGPHIVVVGHPLCHFSRNAVAAIEADPDLARIFANASWIKPQDGRLRFNTMQEWNAQHPGAIYRIAWRESEWPLIDSWATPTFYFIEDGKLAAKVVGWPAEGNRDALLSAADEIGLLP